MSDESRLRQAEEAVHDALRSNPAIHPAEPERGFDACFEVPVARAQLVARGVPLDHLPLPVEDGEGGGRYRVLVALMLRPGPAGRPGVATGVDLEFFARHPSAPEGEWLSATRVRDPESGGWVQAVGPAEVQHLLHAVCPGWAEVVRAEVVRLVAARQAEA